MIFFIETFDNVNSLLGKVIVLEFFYLVLLILHPKYPGAIEIEGHGNFRHLELSVKLNLVAICVYLIKVFVLKL